MAKNIEITTEPSGEELLKATESAIKETERNKSTEYKPQNDWVVGKPCPHSRYHGPPTVM
jgi:hypothetical protein